MDINAHCIVPDWPAPGHVHALVTTRAGGDSTGAYASMNLGLRTDDDQAAVAANRARLQQVLPQAPRCSRPGRHSGTPTSAPGTTSWP